MPQTKKPLKKPESFLTRTTAIVTRCVTHHTFIVVLCALFAGGAAWLILTLFNHQLNPDASSYFTIAQKYAEGDFRHAINGYWGPMLSWLLVPAVWLGVDLPVAGKLLAATTALALLVTTYYFLLSRGVQRVIIYMVTLCMAPLLLNWAVVEAISPDLLMTLLMTLFAIQVSNFIGNPTRNCGIVLGLLGAAMYFTKGFGLFLFIGCIGLIALYQWLRVDRDIKAVIRRYVPMAISFCALVLPFIAVISMKYHAPTINNAGAYNQHVTGPVAGGVQPIEYMGPLVPPNDSAISAWEDPSVFVDLVPGWNPLSSRANLSYFVNNIFYNNINLTISFLYGLGPLVCAGFVVMIIGCLQRKKFQRDYLIFTLVTVLMLLAYALVFVVARYLWAAATLSILALGLWLSTLMSAKVLTLHQVVVGGLLIFGVMSLSIGNYIGDSRNPDIEWYKSAQSLRPIIPKNSKIVSDSFNTSFHTCYYLELQCYNVVAPPPAERHQEYYRQLKSMGVTYYVDYHTRDTDPLLKSFVDEYFTKVDHHITERVPITTYKIK